MGGVFIKIHVDYFLEVLVRNQRLFQFSLKKILDREVVQPFGEEGVLHQGHPVLAPPPLTALPDLCHAPSLLFNLEQLELIFELRSQMADPIHWDTLMH
jgi:hypothetical protein